MALAPTSLVLENQHLEWIGGSYRMWDVFTWHENETGPCHYVIEARRMDNVTWDQVGDVDPGVGFQVVNVGTHAPPGWTYSQIYNRIRVTCYLLPTDPTPGALEASFAFPTQRFRTNLINITQRIDDFGTNGFITFFGNDPSYHIYCANVKAFNMTQGQRQIFSRSLEEGDPALAVNYCNHNDISIGFALSGADLPNPGDRVQIHYRAIMGDGHYPNQLDSINDGIVTIWTFTYSLPVNFPFLSLDATQGTLFAYFLSGAPGITGNPFTATYSIGSGSLPPGLSLASNGNITGTPTTTGTYNCHINTLNDLGNLGGGDLQIIVGVSVAPIITGPAGPFTLNQYIFNSFQLTATRNPTSFALASGSLPTGVTLNTTTGVVSGTPTALQSATPAGFTATNASGTSPVFTINIAVVALGLPVITSPSTATGYRGESFVYNITGTNLVGPGGFTANPLPRDLTLDAHTGYIRGIINLSNNPGLFNITLRAQNISGYSAPFTLALTIADRLPVIVSDLHQTTIAFQEYQYQIVATHFPLSYGADSMPFGLSIDTETGLITGVPVTRGTYNINLGATNSAGTGTAVLVLEVKLDRPVIDISITSGKAITCETGIPLVFQPVATNSPSSWKYAPSLAPDGFTFNTATGRLTGTFSTVGLYGEVFFADNFAGESDPAIFYFLVEQGPAGTVIALGAGMDIYIDIQDGSVSIMLPGQTQDVTTTTTQNNTTTVTKQTVASTPDAAILSSKRGDTLPLTIRFHKNGKPVIIENLSSLIFGVREDFTLPYAVLTQGFSQNDDGSYAIFPNYGANPEIDFEIDDTEEFIELMAEVQWETGNIGDPSFSRRSSQTFKNQIYRDVIFPDEPS